MRSITIGVIILGLSLPAYAGLVEKTALPDTGRMLHHPSRIAPEDNRPLNGTGDLPNRMVLAQHQPSEKDIEAAKKNLGVIKNRLDDRQRSLDLQAEAIRKEREELARIKGGQTLQGSRANAYQKRVAEVNKMQEAYNAEYGRLQFDIETYNAAVEEMKNAVIQSSQPPGALGDPQDGSKREAVKARLEQERQALAARYTALMVEKQRIMAQQPSTQSGSAFQRGEKIVPFDEQMRRFNDQMRDYAHQRNAFNDAVKSFNATTGESIATVPAP